MQTCPGATRGWSSIRNSPNSFERMTYVPLAGKTHLLPPGGGGVGMHVIPVEKAISMENQTLDIEHLSYWLKKI